MSTSAIIAVSRRRTGSVARTLAIGAAYALTALIGLGLDPVGGFATLVWAPTGIALAATLLLGYEALAGILLGAFAANALAGAPPMAAGAVAVGNMLEALGGTAVLRRLGFGTAMPSLRDAFLFILVAALAPLVSATLGVVSLVAAGTLAPSRSAATWQAWWVGDFIGALLVTPPILFWWPRGRTPLSRSQWMELGAIVATLLLVSGAVFLGRPSQPSSFLQAYLVFPVLLWATVRLAQRGAAAAVFFTALIAVIGTARGLGPFAEPELNRSLFALQPFMGIVAVSFLVLSTALAERAEAQAALRAALGGEARPVGQPDRVDSAGALHRQLIESVVDYAIFALDRSGRVLTWNPGAERVQGYPAAEIIGKHFSVFYPADLAGTELPQRELDTAANEGRFEAEGWRVRRDGSRFWANVVVTPLRDESGQVVGFSKVTRDLTAQRRAEENSRQLAASEAAAQEARKAEQAATFLAQATEVLASSLDHQVTLTRLAQLTVPELGDWCVIDARDPDGGLRRVAVAHRDPARVAFARRVEADYPTDMSAPTGVPNVFRTGQAELYPEITDEMLAASARDERHLSILRELGIQSAIVVPIIARQRVDGVLTLVSAESGRRYSAADLELMKELGRRAGLSIENALLLSDARAAAQRNARLQAVTSRLAGIVAQNAIGEAVLSEGIEALGARHAAFCVATEGDQLEIVASVGLTADVVRAFKRFPIGARLPLSDAVRNREALFLQDRADIVRRFPELREANSRATTEAWIALPLTHGDRVIGGVAFGFMEAKRFDERERAFATALGFQAAQALERTRLYAAEQRARAEAEIANRAKSDFLATMSHELRTPLNAIGGYAELLELGVHGEMTPSQGEAVSRIRRSERRLRSLIEDVLSFARIEAGKLDLRVGAVNVRNALVEVEDFARPQLRAKELTFDCSRCSDQLVVQADEEKLQQILINLLMNAVKFTPERGSISMEAVAVGETVEIRVQDTGIGIPADKVAVIFDPFVQLGRSLTTPREGSGLGLAISRDLARAMGGDLRADSEPGRGSTFTLVLPSAALKVPTAS